MTSPPPPLSPVGFGVGLGVGTGVEGEGRVPVLPLELTYVDASQLEESQLTISP